MVKTVLLMVRNLAVSENVQARVHLPDVHLLGGHNAEDMRAAFASQPIDHVIFGGGLELDERLAMVREVFELSNATTIHMNAPSGPESYLPFVEAVLSGVGRL